MRAQFKDDDADHVHELRRLLAVTIDTYNSLVDQVCVSTRSNAVPAPLCLSRTQGLFSSLELFVMALMMLWP